MRAPRTRWLANKVRRLCLEFTLILVAIYLQGYEFRQAVDGHEGVRVFETDGQFEYVFRPMLEPSGHPFTLPVLFCSIYRCQY